MLKPWTKVGAIVVVSDSGNTYSTPSKEVERGLGLNNSLHKRSHRAPEGPSFVLKNMFVGDDSYSTQCFCLIENLDYGQYVIGIEGLKEAFTVKQEKEKPMAIAKTTIAERLKGGLKKVIDAQPVMGKTAATLEGARIINKQMVALASKKLPLMLRGYADTLVGRAFLPMPCSSPWKSAVPIWLRATGVNSW